MCLVVALSVSSAYAQDTPSAVIVRVPGDEDIVMRLHAELNGYRFRVTELPDRPARRSETLTQLAEQRDAQAVLRAKPDIMAVELWVRAPGASSPSQELVNAGPGRDAEVLALRVTEAMRARGLALPQLGAAAVKVPGPAAESGGRDAGVAEPRTLQPGEVTEPAVKPVEPVVPKAEPAQQPPPKPAVKEPAPEAPKPAEPKPAAAELKPAAAEPKPAAAEPKPAAAETNPEPKPELTQPYAGARDALVYAEIGPTAVWSPGPDHIGPALDLLVSFTFRPNQTSSISLVGVIPLLSTDLIRNVSSVDVRTYGIGGFGDLHMPLGRLELSAGLGAMALFSNVQVVPAQQVAEFMSDYATQRLAALLGRVGASLSLTRDLNVRASIMAGLTVQQLQLQFPRPPGAEMSTTPDASWGSPLLFGSLSIELALPWDR